MLNPEVVYQSVSDGGVLLSTRDEVYYGLNGVAARIWELLREVDTLEELTGRLEEEYADVAAETLRADAEELLDDLAAHGLVSRTDGAAADNERGDSSRP